MRDLLSSLITFMKPVLVLVLLVCLADSITRSGNAEVGHTDKDSYIQELRLKRVVRAERVRNKYAGRSPAIEQQQGE